MNHRFTTGHILGSGSCGSVSKGTAECRRYANACHSLPPNRYATFYATLCWKTRYPAGKQVIGLFLIGELELRVVIESVSRGGGLPHRSTTLAVSGEFVVDAVDAVLGEKPHEANLKLGGWGLMPSWRTTGTIVVRDGC